MWRHWDGTIAYYTGRFYTLSANCFISCAQLTSKGILGFNREQPDKANYLCEFLSNTTRFSTSPAKHRRVIHLNSSQEWAGKGSFLPCPYRHVTHVFLACDVTSLCWGTKVADVISCQVDLTPLPPMFRCQNGIDHVPYSLVCDHLANCRDHSDELLCVYPACDFRTHFQCSNKECVLKSLVCNKMPHCSDASDEDNCYYKEKEEYVSSSLSPPAVVTLDGYGNLTMQLVNMTVNSGSSVCPDTHHQCADNGYCLPVFVWCNHIYDCPQHEDEENCDSSTCPGFYRCRASSVCLHPHHLCDGVYQCPQRDDELLCNSTCPDPCTCYGHALFCAQVIPTALYPHLRFLDASDSGLQYADVASNTLLIFLRLARCELLNLTLVHLPNLHSLDLSENHLTSITDHHLSRLPHLWHLTLSDNPLNRFIQHTLESTYLHNYLHSLDVSSVYVEELDVSILYIFPNLHILNLTDCGVNRILADGFQSLPNLHVLDARGCSMTHFSGNVFRGLNKMQTLFIDNYKLCCKEMLPQTSSPVHCHAPSDDISSCAALLKHDVYRIFIAICSGLALTGNLTNVLFRFLTKNKSGMESFDIFYIDLCFADFLMGLYLGTIGVADRVYIGSYLWNDITWRQSVLCQTAGFLSLLSCEVSAFIICLITLDRVLVLRFPFSQLHFHRTSALLTCAGVWTTGLFLAALPLLPMTSHWQFYSQNAICIPLPFTQKDFTGPTIAFYVMIVMNFVLFLLIAVGQAAIYQSVQKNQLADSDCSTRSSKDRTLARRLLTITMTDFLCWFLIGLLGLLASNGHAVASEVNVAMAIFVLPLNSAINPFLYILNMKLERLRFQRQERLKQFLLMQLQKTKIDNTTSAEKCTKGDIVQIFNEWVKRGTLSAEHAKYCRDEIHQL